MNNVSFSGLKIQDPGARKILQNWMEQDQDVRNTVEYTLQTIDKKAGNKDVYLKKVDLESNLSPLKKGESQYFCISNSDGKKNFLVDKRLSENMDKESKMNVLDSLRHFTFDFFEVERSADKSIKDFLDQYV